MPLPVGFEEEQVVAPDIQHIETVDNLPNGFIEEDAVIPQIRRAPETGIFDKVINFFRDPEREVAKSQNIYALAEVTGLPISEINKNYEVLRRSVKVTGITPEMDRKEYMQAAMLPLIAYGAVVNPLGTAAGLVAYGALDKAIPTQKFNEYLKNRGVNGSVIDVVDLADFVGKSMIVGGIFKKAPKLAEGFLKQKITEYKMPETIKLSSEQVKDIFQTGKLTTSEQQSLFGSLGLNSYDLRGALEHGVNINVPAEKIVTLVDKPYWAKVKGILGIQLASEKMVLSGEQPAKAPSGLLELKPQELSVFNNNLSDLRSGISKQAHISDLPIEIATERKIPRSVYIDQKMIDKIESKHNLPVDNEFISNLNSADTLIFPKEEPGKINFIKKLGEDNYLVVATKRFNGHFVITGFTSEKGSYIDNIKEKGDVINLAGEAPYSPIASTLSDQRQPERLSGVSKVTTSPIQNIQQEPENVNSKVPPINPPEVGQELLPQPSGDPIQKVIQAIKEAKSVRGEQETLYAKGRAQKFAKMQAVGEEVRGEKGFYAQLGALKGELPKAEFEAIRNKLTQEDIDSLFNIVKDSTSIGEWEKLSAREGLAKLFGEYGGKVPTENEISLLNKVFGEEFTKAILGKRTLFEQARFIGLQIANIPRSIMASFDLSAPLRQGLFLIGKPKQFFPAFKRMFGAFKSEESFRAIQDAIIKDPDFQLARDSRLALTEMNVLLSEREEAFMSNWAEKIPLIGQVVRASGRAYVGFLNKLRFDTFKDLINKAEISGLKAREDADLSKAIADFINNATGRGTLPNGLQKAAVNLNTLFFSPRLLMSRLNLMNPVYYIKQKPFVRKEALKSLLAFIGFGLTVITLAKMSGAEVGDEPKSSDFGKIKIGNTRFDIWGGFQQLAVMASRLVTGKIVSSTTGKEMTLGEGFKPMTRADIVQHFLESKLAPVPSFILALFKGKDATGQDINIPSEVVQRFIPMLLQDMYDIAQDSPGLLPLGLLGTFGVGVQTYEERKNW